MLFVLLILIIYFIKRALRIKKARNQHENASENA
jgi:hypothetical protein